MPSLQDSPVLELVSYGYGYVYGSIKYYVYGYVYGASDKNGDMDYHLVMTNLAMENPWTKWSFLAGKIIKNGPLPMAMLNNQMVMLKNKIQNNHRFMKTLNVLSTKPYLYTLYTYA